MLFIFLIAVVFRCKDMINGGEMVDLLKQTSIAFIGANGVEHIVGAVKGYMDARNPTAELDDPKTAYEDVVSPSAQEAEDLKEEASK